MMRSRAKSKSRDNRSSVGVFDDEEPEDSEPEEVTFIDVKALQKELAEKERELSELHQEKEHLQHQLENIQKETSVIEFCTGHSEPLVECYNRGASSPRGKKAVEEEATSTTTGGRGALKLSNLLSPRRRRATVDEEGQAGAAGATRNRSPSKRSFRLKRSNSTWTAPSITERISKKRSASDVGTEETARSKKPLSPRSVRSPMSQSPRSAGSAATSAGKSKMTTAKRKDHPVWTKRAVQKADSTTKQINAAAERQQKRDSAGTRVAIFGHQGAHIAHYLYKKFAEMTLSEQEEQLLHDELLNRTVIGARRICELAKALSIFLSEEITAALAMLCEEEHYIRMRIKLKKRHFEAIETILSSSAAQEAFYRRFEANASLVESDPTLPYVMSQYKRVTADGHQFKVSTNDQILTSLKMGINTWECCELGHKFTWSCTHNTSYRSLKWLPQFRGSDAMMYCVSLDAFDVNYSSSSKVLYHQRGELANMLDMLTDITCVMVIFCNKKAFKKKIDDGVELRQCFKDCPGGMDAKRCFKFVKRKFQSALKEYKERVHYLECEPSAPKDKVAIFTSLKELLHVESVESTFGFADM